MFLAFGSLRDQPVSGAPGRDLVYNKNLTPSQTFTGHTGFC